MIESESREPRTADEREVQRLRTELRRAENRLADLRVQLDLRLEDLRQERAEKAQMTGVTSTKLFRITRHLQRRYRAARTYLPARRRRT